VDDSGAQDNDEEIEMIAEFGVDDGIYNLPYHLSEEYYKLHIDSNAASPNIKGKTPIDSPPENILDIYSSTLGDGYRFMGHPKIHYGML
jgi:hypothetical protein